MLEVFCCGQEVRVDPLPCLTPFICFPLTAAYFLYYIGTISGDPPPKKKKKKKKKNIPLQQIFIPGACQSLKQVASLSPRGCVVQLIQSELPLSLATPPQRVAIDDVP